MRLPKTERIAKEKNMAQILDILEKEKQRTAESRCVVHLYQEGSFYRAYEWSAWLCHRFISPFKVTHRNMKGIEKTVLFIGFPVVSLQKHTPEGATVTNVDEKSVDVQFPNAMIPDDMTADMMLVDFEQWKASVPVAEPVQKKDKVEEVAQNRLSDTKLQPSITSIMQRIIAFPIENKTPMQCMSFLAETKQILASMI